MLLAGFVIAQIAIFAGIIFILKKLIFHDTTSAVNRLAKLDDMNREKEKELVKRLEEVETTLAQKKAELAQEEGRMKAESERAATQLYDDIVKKAKIEADEVIKKALAARDKIRADATIEAETKVAEFCGEIVAKVLSPLVGAKISDLLVEEFLTELEKTDMSIINKTVNLVEVVSAAKLGGDAAARIQKVVNTKLGRPIEVKTQQDPSLIGGISLKFGSLVINDSLQEKVREATLELKSSVNWRHKV